MTAPSTPHALPGLNVTLHGPRQVSEGVHYHWFPGLMPMPTGEVIVTVTTVADTAANPVDGYSVYVSRDGGQTFAPPYDVASFGGGWIAKCPQPGGVLAGPDFYAYADPPGQRQRLLTHYERFEAGGLRHVVEAYGARIEGMPRPLEASRHEGTWSRRWPVQGHFYGHALAVDGGHVATFYGKFAGDSNYSLALCRTDDGGRTWRYLSTIATPESIPGPAIKEGPNEATLCDLANGDILCVFRVGGGEGQFLAKATSADGGRSWSASERMAAWSVSPSLRRLQNGVIALSTGRPGLYLWLCTDGRGDAWHSVDIQAHHNATMGPEHQVRVKYKGYGDPDEPAQTTAYTEIIEVTPNRLLLAYDRCPFGWHAVPPDSGERGRIYLLAVDVART